MNPLPTRPTVTELRLSAYRSHRDAVIPLSPLTLLAGPSGSGKSAVLEGYAALGRLAAGGLLPEVFPDPVARVPLWSRPDAERRRGFRLGCTVDGTSGPVRLDLAVQVEPALRVVGERLTCAGRPVLVTALRSPQKAEVYAEWRPGGARSVKARFPDDRLGTALLPLRVAGSTEGQRWVLSAAEQVLIALRSTFSCTPRPEVMRRAVPVADGLLRPDCGNLAAVLHRTRTECARRHAALVTALRTGCAGAVEDVRTERCGTGLVRAVLERGGGGLTPIGWLGDGELRYTALALVLLTGPDVLETDRVEEVLAARQALAVLADGFDSGLDREQAAALLRLAVRTCARGHIRLLGTVRDAAYASGVPAARVVRLNSVDSHSAE